MVEISVRALFAAGGRGIAALIAALSLVLAIALDVVLVRTLGLRAIGVGASVAVWCSAIVMLVVIERITRTTAVPAAA